MSTPDLKSQTLDALPELNHPGAGVRHIMSIDLGSRDFTAAVLAQLHPDGLMEVLEVMQDGPILQPAAIPFEEALAKVWADCMANAPPPGTILVSREFYRDMQRTRHRGTRLRRVGDDEALNLDLHRFSKGRDWWGRDRAYIFVDRRRLKRERRRQATRRKEFSSFYAIMDDPHGPRGYLTRHSA
jgi:hypothetical protein